MAADHKEKIEEGGPLRTYFRQLECIDSCEKMSITFNQFVTSLQKLVFVCWVSLTSKREHTGRQIVCAFIQRFVFLLGTYCVFHLLYATGN